MTLVAFEGVTKLDRQGDREIVVLDDVWLEIEAGEHVALWAERRAGKSRLLRLVAGIELADAGMVRFDGLDLAALRVDERARLLRSEIGFVPAPVDGLKGNRGMQVVDYVAVPLLAAGWSHREAVTRAFPALERVGAARYAYHLPSELSLGEQTRVAIARGLVREPRLLLVDEPAVTPSPAEQDEIRGLLRSLGRSPELTLVVASEEPAVLRGAGRVVSLSGGRVLTSDRPGTIVAFPGVSHRRGSSP